MQPWMPGGANRQGIGAGGRVLDYDIYSLKGINLGMRAIARDFHDTMQIVTDDIMRYRSFTLNPHQFDAS